MPGFSRYCTVSNWRKCRPGAPGACRDARSRTGTGSLRRKPSLAHLESNSVEPEPIGLREVVTRNRAAPSFPRYSMTDKISDNKARQGPLGLPVLVVLIAALLLAFAAWGVAEIYGVAIKTPSTEEQNTRTDTKPAVPTDPSQSPSDVVNSQPTDRNPKVDKNPTPQSSTGGDQQGVQPSQPAAH